MKKLIIAAVALFLLIGCCGEKCRSKRKSIRWCPDACHNKICEPCKYDTVKECDEACCSWDNSCRNNVGCRPCFHCGECLGCESNHVACKGCPELPEHQRKSLFFTCNQPETTLLTKNY